jgi:GTP-binding protein HflX
LNYSIDKIFIQSRSSPNPKYYVGTGKAREIAEYIQNNEIDLVIINAQLKASQFFNLERILKKRVFDRIRLILEIFNDRANSREAKLQVDLARLQYEIPLVNEWIHRAKKGERPGFLAGGEYAVQQYYDLIRKRIKKTKEKLEKLKKERTYRRDHRKKFGFYLVSLAGYTNAGKSTLLNVLTDSNVLVEKRMFSTLSTTTRKIKEGSKQILLTDTVGFIRDLPPWLVEAFHSTLEEIFYSDIILLVIDISESIDEVIKKVNTCYQILWTSDNVPTIIPVFNKIDLESMKDARVKINKLKEQNLIEDYVYISAREELFLDNLIDKIHALLPELKKYRVDVYTDTSKSIIDYLEDNFYILNIRKENMDEDIPIKIADRNHLSSEKIVVDFECNIKDEVPMKKHMSKYNGLKLTNLS